MPLLPRRFERLKDVLNHRMSDLTVLLEEVEKPHNLSAILRSCDAVGTLEVHSVNTGIGPETFNSTAQGSQKWVKVQNYANIEEACEVLKGKGFRLYGTNLTINARDYRECNFCEPTAFVLGTEKWGLSERATELMDESIYIPMRGMVQSLNVSVAAAILLFEALRQREIAGTVPTVGEGLAKGVYSQKLFEWAYPQIAQWCKDEEKGYPELNEKGEIMGSLPRTSKSKY